MHKFLQDSVGKYMCSYCDFTSSKQTTVSEHVSRLHAKEAGRQINPFVCKYCEEMFQSRSAELHHIKTHHEIHLNYCPHKFCSYGAKHNAALNTHYARKHIPQTFSIPTPSAGIVECTICKKTMKQASIHYHIAKCYALSPFFTESIMHDDGGETILFKPAFPLRK